MKIDCIADLHGHYPKLEGGDLLIVAGDLMDINTLTEHAEFTGWLYKQKYNKKVVIAGNHDNYYTGLPGDEYIYSIYNEESGHQFSYANYLCDSGTEFKGMKIWGSPWTKAFDGMNPACKAFTCETDKELAEKWALIPDDTEILVTHGPPFSILDKVREGFNVGSVSLLQRIGQLKKLKLHVFGHIHLNGGTMLSKSCCFKGMHEPVMFVNCAHMDESYDPVNGFVSVSL